MVQPVIPANHQMLMPYLMLSDASGFLKFAKNVFGAQESYKRLRADQTIQHAQIDIGGCTLMLCDSTGELKPQNAALFLYVDQADDMYRKGLAEGATSVMEPADQDYGRSAGITDPFGNTWWITSVR